ncbi:MAG: tRNA (adenosine(37)-N6)-threonylcarbamoyltransferase complex dimerization subunit type 1 TsaB [Lachnospiraceae bacterium]|nr:tRNA (adenosine(37)-N6)-threonylcarbamoyltransferase complex dimerization subunit type 1 TsaB [Lachnospiraceae bacterium]
MRILGIESSALVASAAILEGEKITARYSVDHKLTHSQTLMPMIDEIMRMTGLRISDMDAVAVSGGPGSFTGLRIGGTTAKALAMAADLPIIHVPTLEAMAYNLCAYNGFICPIMDARRSEVYTGIYAAAGGQIRALTDEMAVPVDELTAMIRGRYLSDIPVMFLGDGVPVFKERIAEALGRHAAFAPPHLSRQDAASVAVLGALMYERGEYTGADDFSPRYLRQSQAEREYVEVRPATVDDLDDIAAMERETFPDAWSKESVAPYIDSSIYGVLTARRKGSFVGYAIYQNVAGEGELFRIAVDKGCRRSGIGRRLMTVMEEKAPADLWSLEVRSGNHAAIGLYESMGYRQTRVRQDYYRDPAEDALIMEHRVREQI